MKLLLGDCLEQMQKLPARSVAAVVTDPPYGLSFMGKRWDYDVPSKEIWKEVLRLLKPGGHLLSFGGTRTYHRMVVQIEDAGFEIRDQIQWIYGSGFPKSHDISKGLDKRAGAKRPVTGKGNKGPNIRGNKYLQVHGQEAEQFMLTAPVTEAAKLANGWGTALKPANEPIVLARRPFEGTQAQNARKWKNSGGLNIDACRIAANDQAVLDAAVKRMTGNAANNGAFQSSTQIKPNSAQGRWPANVLFDEDAAAALDAQSGFAKDKPSRTGKPGGHTFGGNKTAHNKSGVGTWPAACGVQSR